MAEEEAVDRRPADRLFDGWEQAWSGRDTAAFERVCDPDVHYEDPLTKGPYVGVDELGELARRLWGGFPDVRLERAGERLTDGRYLAAPAKLAGTHREAVDGLPATNRFVVIHCLFYCELRGGRLLRVRAFYDLYDAATQLGVLPRHGTLGEKALLTLRGFGLRSRG
ncbi:MAG TPA: ester cyclase [Conexibacter sp.]|nr:ester cyclase [Conexibacter sp.]